MNMTKAAISLRGLRKTYAGSPAVDCVHLDVDQREVIA
jgi:ABC-type Fe3+/spermidine/putrescine transport system ATPase subunit